MKATDIRKGHVLMIDGQPCRVMDFTHRTPGNLRAFVQVRFRNLVSGNTFDQRLAATDFLQEARLDTKEMQVLYQDQGGVHVMDQQTYEQFTLDERAVGEDTPWLQPAMVVRVEWLDRRPHKAKAPLDQRLAHRRGFFRLGWHPAERLPGVDLRFPADKLPEKLIE